MPESMARRSSLWAPATWSRAAWAVGFIVAVVVTAWSHLTQWETTPVLAVAYSLIGLGWLGTARLLWHQPDQASNARLFLLLTVVWILGEVARRDIDALYQPTLFAAQYPQILCAALLLRYPRRDFDPLGRAYFVSGLVLATIFAIPLVLLAPGPDRPGDAPGRLLDSLGPYRFGDVQFGRSIVWAVYSVLFVALFLARWRRLTKFERGMLAPILVSAIAAAVTIGAAPLEPALTPAGLRGLGLARGLAGVGVSAAFLASARRVRLARGSVVDLMERLSGPVTEPSVRDALVAVFADSSIDVVSWTPEVETTLATSGRLVLPIPGSDEKPLALAAFPPDLCRHTALLRSHLAVCGLAIENARQLRAVQEARTRLLQAGLAERRKLERDLHDGAQQRLLALGMKLGALEATADTPKTAEALHRVRGELHQAQQELRDLAHGIYPTALTRAGLGPALESVVERLAIPFALRVPARRWNQDLENALYLAACEAIANIVKHAGPCQARIDVSETTTHLELRVHDLGTGFSVTGAQRDPHRPILGPAADRLAAVHGDLWVSSVPGQGTTVVARVPLATSWE
jgi:signal transduction histidine kinase